MKQRLFLLTLIGMLLLAACAPTPTPTPAQLRQWPVTSTTVSPTGTPKVSPSTSTPTSKPSSTPTSTPTPMPTPTVTPTPAPQLRQLTSGGCCTAPFWSPMGDQVRFIDRPASRPVGIYGVDVAHPGPPKLVSERVVNTTGDGAFYVYPDGARTVLERVVDGETYVIDNGGRPVSVSPDGRWAMWQVTDQSGDFDKRLTRIWVSNVDGSAPHMVAQAMGLGGSRWIDGRHILSFGMPVEGGGDPAIVVLTLDDAGQVSASIELARADRPRGTSLSPGGTWLIYLLSFQTDPADDGLWLAPTDGHVSPRHLTFFGGYRWRDDVHLLYVPLEPGAESHVLWEYDVVGDTHRPLTDPGHTPFKIANNGWAVAPGGDRIVFINADDHNLWVIELP